MTIALGGESYLNFMGNEFGHPEWIDFPRVDTYDTSTGAFIPGEEEDQGGPIWVEGYRYLNDDVKDWEDYKFCKVKGPSSPKQPVSLLSGNGGSLDKCRRRWDICDNDTLRYKYMNAYDRAMIHLDKAFGYISAPHQ